ncbi:MAG: type I-B CRISPR-associated endonuclease Cas1 [Firmicutes bacterium]|nr:type I-B CRISPR-associated endonuclease Cas1 [Bacillota bacterium]
MKKSIYIFNDGDLKRKDNTFYFETGKGKNYLPIENINDIYVFGEVTVSKKFMELVSQKEITLHFFNYYGYYTGSFYPREHYNSGYIILQQSQFYLNYMDRMELAVSFVTGSAENILKVLTYYENRGSGLTDIIEDIQNLLDEVERANDVEHLMAIEGNIREHYYNGFDRIINNDDFEFKRRSKRPPKNYLNALISFGNSMLYVTVLSEIYKTHLDPRIGYLHSTNSRSFTLNLDVAEIFKPIIVDRIIFKLINTSMLTINDFVREMGGILLSEKGRKTFVREFDQRMLSTIKHRGLNRNVSYRRLIRLELYKLQKHIMGEEEYQPFKARW